MKKWVTIPQGEFLVNVTDSVTWEAIQVSMAFRGIEWFEVDEDIDEDGISMPDFLLVTNTCPCARHMGALSRALGIQTATDLPTQT